MKVLGLFLSILICSSAIATVGCNRIPNGKYRVDITTEGYDDFELVIHNNKFTQLTKDGRESSGMIEWMDCDFILKQEHKPDSLGMISMTINLLGDPVYEIGKTKGRKTEFRATRKGNRHITINEGKLIKIE